VKFNVHFVQAVHCDTNCEIDRFLKVPSDAFQVSNIALFEIKKILKIQDVRASEKKNLNVTLLC